MQTIEEYVIDHDCQGDFDPFGRREVLRADDVHCITHNHIEGFDFAPIEMHDLLLDLMKAENKNPSLANKAACYDVIKSMICEYWADKKEKHEMLIREAVEA